MDQLGPLLSHQGLSQAVQVLGGRLAGLDGQGGDSSDWVWWAELDWQGGRFGTSQVAHFTHGGWRVVQVGAELADPLGGRQREGSSWRTHIQSKEHFTTSLEYYK